MTQLDTTLFLWINATDATPAGLIALARWISAWLPALAFLAPLPWVLAGRLRHRQWLGACLAMGLAWLAMRGLRDMFHSARPFELGLGHQWIAHAATSGFPSAHTTLATAWAVGISLLAQRHVRRWLLATGGVALLVAWSRVFLGLHFVSDIAAGLLLGTLCGLVVFQGFAWFDRRRAMRTPAPSVHS
ncbi:phosphatase PAP2 family protein [Hydrogenophaga sp.]|uniref:phosphatase PAP2 family protein n=1 Tax=Hydrogenophaga sp. TaxID=1904254 RepID=UPI002629885B|nr:phosphatase PAP2 family protein [Hydrogenophaga sp.]MCW5653955.1 phosphatase PAP2 family protein [Hydrogenophaga sp.]